jgi:hypothetical protein
MNLAPCSGLSCETLIPELLFVGADASDWASAGVNVGFEMNVDAGRK